jgi:cardiolipin synthase A/B
MLDIHLSYALLVPLIFLYVIGFFTAVYSISQARTPQGAAAWVLGLIGFPLFALPFFFVFGKKRFEGYLKRMDEVYEKNKKYALNQINSFRVNTKLDDPIEEFISSTDNGFIGNNKIDLLINGDVIYQQMFEDIAKAQEYILLQVYIFRTDRIGTKFAEQLMKKAQEGLKVTVLYEKPGISMSSRLLKRMKDTGISLGKFAPGRRNKLHINFRNHRKILIIDGKVGFFGGLNIGDEYLGRKPEIGHWRDTNVRVEGPAVMLAQIATARDWEWSQNKPLDVKWNVTASNGKTHLSVITSGPVSERPMGLLLHIGMMNLAKKRLWIANPYVIPPDSLVDTISVAKLRGVDVRIIVPAHSDNKITLYAAEIYYKKLLKAGIRIFKYQRGFMHQKVTLIDDSLALVGSANLDFRSMYINFEDTIACTEKKFVYDIEKMLLDDFTMTEEIKLDDYENVPFLRKTASYVCNLFAPVI